MNLEAQRHLGCDSDEQRLMMNNTSNEYPLMTQVLSDTNIAAAWKYVKANKGAPGIDIGFMLHAKPEYMPSLAIT